MGAAAVFLDRDGVLTAPVVVGDRERPPWTMDELRIVPGVAPVVEDLRAAGFKLVMITNQPDIGRGDALAGDVASINNAVADALGLDGVYVCPHDGASACECRKPRPGMLRDAATDLGLDLARSWLIGDRWVDIAAGRAAGVHCVLLRRPGSWQPTSAGPPPSDLRPDAVVDDLPAAVRMILGAEPTGSPEPSSRRAGRGFRSVEPPLPPRYESGP